MRFEAKRFRLMSCRREIVFAQHALSPISIMKVKRYTSPATLSRRQFLFQGERGVPPGRRSALNNLIGARVAARGPLFGEWGVPKDSSAGRQA